MLSDGRNCNYAVPAEYRLVLNAIFLRMSRQFPYLDVSTSYGCSQMGAVRGKTETAEARQVDHQYNQQAPQRQYTLCIRLLGGSEGFSIYLLGIGTLRDDLLIIACFRFRW
jgi:hypothetical protein